MLNISRAQLDALARDGRAAFDAALTTRLASSFPIHFADLTEDRARSYVSRRVQVALDHGASDAEGIYLFVSLTLGFTDHLPASEEARVIKQAVGPPSVPMAFRLEGLAALQAFQGAAGWP